MKPLLDLQPRPLPRNNDRIDALPPLTPNPAFEALIAQSNTYCYSVDYRTGRFRYVSPGIRRVLGYDREAWQFGGPQKAFECIHPEDQGCVRRICAEIHHELKLHPIEARSELSFAFTCRVRNVGGTYLHLNHQLTFQGFCAAGHPLAAFTMVYDISALNPPHFCVLHICSPATPGRAETRRTLVIHCESGVSFSRREREVLQLITDGLNSQEIAARLFISYNTVCTHRKNLLRKAGVRGSVALLGFIAGR